MLYVDYTYIYIYMTEKCTYTPLIMHSLCYEQHFPELEGAFLYVFCIHRRLWVALDGGVFVYIYVCVCVYTYI